MRQLKDIKTIGIAGAGLMGASIAQIFSRWGYDVIIYDKVQAGLEKGQALIQINQDGYIETGKLTAEQSTEIVKRISFTTEMTSFAMVDFVVECIFENMEVKHDFWSAVSEIVSQEIVLTSNTSGLSITEIAKAVKNPQRFVGMHWVNPPHIVPLVEVIAGEKTEEEAMKIVWDVAEAIHRKPARVSKDARGFVLNRLQFAVLREAFHIVESGIATMEDVDNVMKYGLGMRYAAIGPFETVDLGGLDTFYHVGSYMFADLSNRQEVPHLLADRFAEGAYGVKTGKGLYDYPGNAAVEKVQKRDRDFIKLAECLFETV